MPPASGVAMVRAMLGPAQSWARRIAMAVALCGVTLVGSTSAKKNSPAALGLERFETTHGFTEQQIRLLRDGQSVKRAFTIAHRGATYHAGYSYRLVETSPREVLRALRRPGGLVKAIPYALSATTLWEKDGVSRMRIAQGKRPIVGKYTVHVEWDTKNHGAKFWLDPGADHDINDLWGVIAAREIEPGLTLVSFGFAFDIGGVGSILENKAQAWGLTTADRIAELVEDEPAP